jgi:hypothetical protein
VNGLYVLTSVLNWLREHELASTWADVFGIVGFTLTLIVAWRARSAALAAKEAAEKTRNSIRLFDTVVDFQATISMLEELKRTHRQNVDLSSLPERYASIRKHLILLRNSGVTLDDEQESVVQNAIANMQSLERQGERSVATNTPVRADKLNALISDDLDALLTILQRLKRQGEGV